MNLIIVESPTKARTLSRFLGKGYEVAATMGHIKDLPPRKIGVEINPDDFFIPSNPNEQGLKITSYDEGVLDKEFTIQSDQVSVLTNDFAREERAPARETG